MLAKAQTMGVDSICFDLEDSVTANSKVAARQHVQELLRQPKGSNMKEYAVRINAIGTGLEEDDLKAVVGRLPGLPSFKDNIAHPLGSVTLLPSIP